MMQEYEELLTPQERKTALRVGVCVVLLALLVLCMSSCTAMAEDGSTGFVPDHGCPAGDPGPVGLVGITDQDVRSLISDGTVCRVLGEHRWATNQYTYGAEFQNTRTCQLCKKYQVERIPEPVWMDAKTLDQQMAEIQALFEAVTNVSRATSVGTNISVTTNIVLSPYTNGLDTEIPEESLRQMAEHAMFVEAWNRIEKSYNERVEARMKEMRKERK